MTAKKAALKKRTAQKTAARKSAPKKSAAKKSRKKPAGAAMTAALRAEAIEFEFSSAVAAEALSRSAAPPEAKKKYRVVGIPNISDVLVYTWNPANLSWDFGQSMTRAEAHALIAASLNA